MTDLENKVYEFEPKRSEWISVEDELPVYDSEYSRKHGYDKSYIVMINGASEATVLDFDGGTFYDVNIDIEYNVTHWQPLPEPPKEVIKK